MAIITEKTGRCDLLQLHDRSIFSTRKSYAYVTKEQNIHKRLNTESGTAVAIITDQHHYNRCINLCPKKCNVG